MAASVVVLSASLTLLPGCSDATDDAADIIKQQAALMEHYVDAMESAKNADDVASAIEQYTDDMKVLIPQLKEFEQKYQNADQEALAAEVEKEMDRVEKAGQRLPAAMMKAATYMMDPKVQQAMTRMSEELGDMQ
ncbi:MAG: hypothetical protein R3F47_08455 [Gammaproteobacteria bacterium]